MRVAPAYRDRPETEVAVLAALVDRQEDGMTVFELRSHVETDIDGIETALGALKEDGLIVVESGGRAGDSAVIKPADHVVASEDVAAGESVFDRLRDRLPF